MSKPFNRLYKNCPPDKFAALFGGEAMQTRAFLLSFCPGADYVEQVLALTGDEDFTNLVTDYLSRVAQDKVGVDFVRRVETYLDGIIQNQGETVTRKNIVIGRDNKEAVNL